MPVPSYVKRDKDNKKTIEVLAGSPSFVYCVCAGLHLNAVMCRCEHIVHACAGSELLKLRMVATAIVQGRMFPGQNCQVPASHTKTHDMSIVGDVRGLGVH